MRRTPSTSSMSQVVLRDVQEGDLPTLFEHQADPEGCRMAAFTARAPDAFTTHWAKILADPAKIKRTILFDGAVAGNVVCWENQGHREIGYWIGRAHWGKGIASRAVAAFLAEVAIRPLHAHVAKHNIASIRVLEKNGFTITGEDHCPAPTGGHAVEEFIMTLA